MWSAWLGSGSRRAFVFLVLVAVASRCASAPPLPPAPSPAPAARPLDGNRVLVGDPGGGHVRAVPLDEYVAGSLAAELGPVLLDPLIGRSAGRLQAFVTRTYAMANRHRHSSFDVCDTTHCQLYRPPDSLPADLARAARTAAHDTSGLVVLFERRPIQALFHADCGGATSAASLVWGGPAPRYLQSVADRYCPGPAQRAWQVAVPAERLREALNDHPRTRVGSRLTRIDILEIDAANRAVRVALDGERSPVVRGEEFRQVVTRRFGAGSIRSTRFTVRRDGDRFVFEGRGFGHGVGLCQAGALAQLRAGRTAEAILQMYFPGVTIGRLPRQS